MSLHHDPHVDRAMRAVLGAGSHFWDPDSMRFHKSRPIEGRESGCGRWIYVIERYRTAYMGGHKVQHPHDRVLRVCVVAHDDHQVGDLSVWSVAKDGQTGWDLYGDKQLTPRKARQVVGALP